jgi:DnaJ like chaperone protein
MSWAIMSWFSTLIWGAVGFQLGGPLGAILGATTAKLFQGSVGHAQRNPTPRSGRVGAQHQHQLVFFTTTFSLLGKLAKADGIVSKEEIQVVDQFIQNGLQLDEPQRRAAIEIFNRAKDSEYSARNFAEQFVSFFGQSPQMVTEMLRLLYRVAAADGVLHPGEKAVLDETAHVFGISAQEHDRIRVSFFPSTDGYYARLGCTRADSMDVIKTRYKKLVLENHPDRMVAQGMPDEFVQLANEKLQGINEAYDAIKRERGV